jgi:putative endonuclease
MEKGGWLYIMADRYRGSMYVGVTADLIRRVQQHREGRGSIHVTENGLIRIVYAEWHTEIAQAIIREKLVKKWKREWKFACSKPKIRTDTTFGTTGFRSKPSQNSLAPCQARGDGSILCFSFSLLVRRNSRIQPLSMLHQHQGMHQTRRTGWNASQAIPRHPRPREC